MTATDTQPVDVPEDDWRGRVKDSQNDELPIDESVPRRREARALLCSLLRPYRLTVALLAIVVVVENVARLSVPLLVQRGIDHGIPPILSGGPAHTLMVVVGVLCGVVLIQATSRMFFLQRSGRIGQKVLLELRRRVYRHFQRLDIAFHERYTSGRVVSRSTNDVEAIQDMLETGFDSLITAVLTLIGTSILLVTLDVRLGLMCLAGFPVLVALVWWFRNESAKTYRKVRESAALVIVQFVETMTGIKAVQAYRREPRNQEIFEDIADRYKADNEKTFRLLAIFMPGVKLVGNITTGVVLLYGGYRVLHGQMTIGTLAAFLLYLRMFFEPMQEISQFFNTFQSASSALEKLAGVLAEQPGIKDPERPVRLERVRGDVAFHDVQFSYVPERPVLPDLSVSVPAGQTVALVGTTGAGKTTIAKLIARFYDPTSGSVTLDGVDLRDLSQSELRRHVVMVTQENFMFDGTVADNIRFGRPDATDDGSGGGRRGGRRGPVHRRAARRLRHRRREARRPALGGAAAAGRVRARISRRPGGADPRRGHVVAGHPKRADGAAGAGNGAGRTHFARHRAPAVHGAGRRPGAGARAWPHRRGRRARRSHRPHRRPVRRAAPRVGGVAGLVWFGD